MSAYGTGSLRLVAYLVWAPVSRSALGSSNPEKFQGKLGTEAVGGRWSVALALRT